MAMTDATSKSARSQDVLERVAAAIESRRGADPASSYVAALFAKGDDAILKKIGDEIITPPLTGTILPGVTRDSTLALLRKWGLKVSERQVSIDEVVEAHGRGKLEEVWGTGTAAVISPVGELAYQGKKMVINGGKIGPLTQKLYDAIVAIQYGKAPDPDGWTLAI